MKEILPYILIMLIPSITFGQLFPTPSDFNGDINKVVEKRYGRDVYLFNQWTGINLSSFYSGWKYTYYFDKNGRLSRRINEFKGKLRADFVYEYDSSENLIIEREIVNDTINNHKSDYIEDEYILDWNGKIEKVNIWSFHSLNSSKERLVVEKNIMFDCLNNITSYYRHGFDSNGKEIKGELYEIFYNNLAKVIRVTEKTLEQKKILSESGNPSELFNDTPIIESKLLKEWIYKYNSKEQLISYTVKYYNELNEVDSNHTLSFKYDQNNNWIKKYTQSDDSKKRLIAKRRINYR